MLTYEAVVDEVEGKLQHSLRSGGLRVDLCCPFECDAFEIGVVDDRIDHAHAVRVFSGIFITKKKDLACEFLADLTREVSAAEAAVEACDVCVGLFELGVLTRRDREVTHHMQAVAAACGPAGDDADDDLAHETNQALHFENVEASGLGSVDSVGGVTTCVLVSRFAANSLIATRAERPDAVFGRGSVAGEQYAANIGALTSMVERPVELIDGGGPKRIANFRTVKGDPHRALVVGSVVGDVTEIESGYGMPCFGVKNRRNHLARLRCWRTPISTRTRSSTMSAAQDAFALASALVGTQEGTGEWFEIDQARVNAFADATLDHQFIHVDPEAAKATPFGGPIAHGFLTLSMLVHLSKTIQQNPEVFKGAVMGVNYGMDKVRFISPVPVGSRVRASSVISDVVLKDANTIQMKKTLTVEIEGVSKPALIAEWITLTVYG